MNQTNNSSILRDACTNYQDTKNLEILKVNALARLIVDRVCKKLSTLNSMGADFRPIKEYVQLQPLAIELDQLSNNAFVDLFFEDSTESTITLPVPNKDTKALFTKGGVVKLANLRKSYTERLKNNSDPSLYGDSSYLILNLQTPVIQMIEDEVERLLMSSVPRDFDMEWKVTYSTQAFSQKAKGKNGDKDRVVTNLRQGFSIVMKCN